MEIGISFALREAGRDAPALWRIDTERPSRPQIIPFSEGAADPEISVAGRRLVYDRFKADSNVWRALNPKYSETTAAPPTRFLSSTQPDSEPQYSPDGRRIAFLSSRSGQTEIWVANEDGSEQRALTSAGAVGAPQWSPDGKMVVLAREGELYTVDIAGGVPKHIKCDSAPKAAYPSYSRDGRWIYFGSNRTGTQQIWRLPARGGTALPVTTAGGARPLESADGQFLFYVKTEGAQRSLWRMPSGGGPEQRIFETGTPSYSRAPQFALSLRELYCIRYNHPDRTAGIDLVNPRTGAIRRTLTLNMPERFSSSGFSVSPDGRWFLYGLYDFEDDIMQFINFR